MRTGIAARNWAVAILDSHSQAQRTVERLREAGFSMGGLSIAGRGGASDGQATGCYLENGHVRYAGEPEACWTRLWEYLPGWAAFAIPQIGQVLIAGALSGWVAATVENAAIFPGLSALGAGLYGLGIPRSAVAEYEAAVKAGKLLAIVHGAAEDVRSAKEVVDAVLAGG
jgi:hypothetical protein